MMQEVGRDGLYGALEQALRAANEPMDCQSLYELPEVREHANSVNRVSDYLGNMWRRGDVLRVPAPRLGNSRARWMYVWKGRTVQRPTVAQVMENAQAASASVQTLLQRPSMEITQEGRKVVITLPNFTITITQN